MPARDGAHRRPPATRPLWPRTSWSRQLVVRLVWLYAAFLVSATYDREGLGPVEVGVAVTALCVWAELRTAVPPSMVRLVQRAASLTLLLVGVALWVRGEAWGTAAGALALSLSAQWWMEEDERRRTSAEEVAWRAQLLHELHVVRRSVTTAEAGLRPAILDALRGLRGLALLTPLPDTLQRRPVRGHHVRPVRRRGAHRAGAPVARTHRPPLPAPRDRSPHGG